MKLFYYILFLLSVKQLVRTAPIDDSTSSVGLTPKEQLAKYYMKEFNSITKNIPEKLKEITENLLKDEVVEQADTPLMYEFKKNLKLFQQVYPHLMRYSWQKTLILTFSNAVKDFYDSEPKTDEDFLYIKQLLKTLGYDEIREKYKSEFQNFFSENLLPKYEDVKNNISNEVETEDFENMCLKWINKLKQCEVYECYLNSFDDTMLTLKQTLFKNIGFTGGPIALKLYNDVYVFAKDLLKEPRFSELDPALKIKITNSTEDFISKYENSKDVPDVGIIVKEFISFLTGTTKNIKDRLLLRDLFIDLGLNKTVLFFEIYTNDWFEDVFLKDLKRFIDSLNITESVEYKQYLDLYNRSKQKTKFSEKHHIIEELRDLNVNDMELNENIVFL